ncbi:bifunctional SulP family inorganic anion transporter/carbonic anhydrase [Streptomyces sp. TRM 70351]|uniref:bifunctional SulP family inorganic anion transporter/carbonic anhydrase n=1 Tax=Streptomyces sp. TRM 70351 TaxID=3116552 RepID=UPI002E7C1402|nr:bifunctional SulP family inorganic anion transporter/carbonic anhydrase [Streptomyces sp. TRM 70351]MEE1930267.1 bifunctional SulP family inorganic anion transporter/carbonic anhydrase [Streptomyces sp. TRM 70351]
MSERAPTSPPGGPRAEHPLPPPAVPTPHPPHSSHSSHPDASGLFGSSGGPGSPAGPGSPHRPGGPGPAAAPRGRWSADLSASVAVFLVALPLSLGIALATGAPLQAGLVAAAVGGIVAGRLGGAPLQVSGPAAGLTVVTAELIQTYGWQTTCVITIVAGLTQLGLAHARVARSALMVSPAIVHGMLAGIGVTIAVAQLHIVLGGSPESSVIENVRELPQQLSDPHPAALSVSALTVAALLLWPRLRGRWGKAVRTVPGPLAAVVLSTGFAVAAGLHLPRVDLPSWRSHALPGMPEGPVLGLLAAVLTITLVASVESLLSAIAIDKLTNARTQRTGERPIPRADLDKELRGQGAANVVSGALGGLPVTGVAVRSSANVSAGAVSRNSAILHGCWVALAAGLLVALLEFIPLASLAALVMVVGVQMVNLTHIRTVTRHREAVVYAPTTAGVVLLGVLEGVAIGIAVAIGVALHRLARTRIVHEAPPGPGAPGGASGGASGGDASPSRTTPDDGTHRVVVRGQLTFLAVPRLTRTLNQVPHGSRARVELDGSFIDHAAFESLQDWRTAHVAHGGEAEITGRAGARIAEPASVHHCTPWTPWRNHHCTHPGPEQEAAGARPERRGQLLGGVRDFQRHTAPLVRDELARLSRDGQQPSHLFLTCADSRLVTSMITSSGPGDLYTVRNVGNLVPFPGRGTGDHSVAAAIEYAVHVLEVGSITVCGHSGCGAMQTLYASRHAPPENPLPQSLSLWLRHGQPSLRRLAERDGFVPRLADRPVADGVEALCLANVLQQLEHLRAHACVAQRLAEGSLELHGMYFHVADAQAYVLDATDARGADAATGEAPVFVPPVFTPVPTG